MKSQKGFISPTVIIVAAVIIIVGGGTVFLLPKIKQIGKTQFTTYTDPNHGFEIKYAKGWLPRELSPDEAKTNLVLKITPKSDDALLKVSIVRTSKPVDINRGVEVFKRGIFGGAGDFKEEDIKLGDLSARKILPIPKDPSKIGYVAAYMVVKDTTLYVIHYVVGTAAPKSYKDILQTMAESFRTISTESSKSSDGVGKISWVITNKLEKLENRVEVDTFGQNWEKVASESTVAISFYTPEGKNWADSREALVIQWIPTLGGKVDYPSYTIEGLEAHFRKLCPQGGVWYVLDKDISYEFNTEKCVDQDGKNYFQGEQLYELGRIMKKGGDIYIFQYQWKGPEPIPGKRGFWYEAFGAATITQIPF